MWLARELSRPFESIDGYRLLVPTLGCFRPTSSLLAPGANAIRSSVAGFAPSHNFSLPGAASPGSGATHKFPGFEQRFRRFASPGLRRPIAAGPWASAGGYTIRFDSPPAFHTVPAGYSWHLVPFFELLRKVVRFLAQDAQCLF
jgi:hypothetical protein